VLRFCKKREGTSRTCILKNKIKLMIRKDK
jgi:hypothetical protein